MLLVGLNYFCKPDCLNCNQDWEKNFMFYISFVLQFDEYTTTH